MELKKISTVTKTASNNNLTFDDILSSTRIAFAKYISDQGYTPSEAEQKIAATVDSIQKSGSWGETVGSILSGAKSGLGMAILTGGVTGGLIGMLRASIMNNIDSPIDVEDEVNKEKYKRYLEEGDKLRETMQMQMGNQAIGKTPRINEAMR